MRFSDSCEICVARIESDGTSGMPAAKRVESCRVIAETSAGLTLLKTPGKAPRAVPLPFDAAASRNSIG